MRRAIGGCVLACLLVTAGVRADDWPQWLGPKRDGVWRESGVIDTIPAGGLKAAWRTPVGEGYAGPAVAAGRVYVTDRVRGEGTANPKNPFDSKTAVAGAERVLCLDDATGKPVWTHRYPCVYKVSYASGPRCTPVIDGDRVYTLGTMGDLFCLNAADGKPVWSKNFPRDFKADVPVWGFSSHPLIDGDKLICLVGGADRHLVVAFDKKTGDVRWHALSCPGDFGYCPPVIFDIHGTRTLVIWHTNAVAGLDPETGKRLWEHPWSVRVALTAPTPRYDAGKLFLTAFYNGPLMLKFEPGTAKPTVLWKGKSESERPDRTDGLHSIMPTPILHGDTIFGVCSYGELRGLDANTGQRLWADMRATTADGKPLRWGNAFLVEQADRTWLFNERGELILAKLSRDGYTELGRAKLLDPTNKMAPGRPAVVWTHPAFANRAVYARNDAEIVKVPLGK